MVSVASFRQVDGWLVDDDQSYVITLSIDLLSCSSARMKGTKRREQQTENAVDVDGDGG